MIIKVNIFIFLCYIMNIISLAYSSDHIMACNTRDNTNIYTSIIVYYIMILMIQCDSLDSGLLWVILASSDPVVYIVVGNTDVYL